MVYLRSTLFASASTLYAIGHAATITTTNLQTVNGIGASGAWWVNDIAKFPSSVQQNISNLLLSQTSGLGLTDYRYNLGGGGVGVNTQDRVAQTPYKSDGNYDWTADAAGTFFLKEAARQGVPQITLFVNSAPSTFTSNGKTCGGTLITSRIPAYAQYLTDVVSHWKSQGVTITHVSPMNEPDNTFGDCGQEGMQVTVSQRAQVLTTISQSFRNAGLSTKVIGDETSQEGQFVSEAPNWLNTNVGSSIAAVCHHQYAFVDGPTQLTMANQARSLSGGDEVWATEICCTRVKTALNSDPLSSVSYGSEYDPTILGGLRMANLIYQSLGNAQENHWDWWTALSNQIGNCNPSSNANCLNVAQSSAGWNDGLIYYDPNFASTGFHGLGVTKRFSVLKHFTKAAPIGAVVRSVTTSSSESKWRILAFDFPKGKPFAIIAMNMQTAGSSITLTPASGLTLSSPKSAVRTSANEDYASIGAPALSGGSITISNAPALSIYTLFF
ncbi:glycoside hydrolase family 30 protein [Peniophora sp. CONT]|nr:glycoside hydrolase family 30 protein [Peniophora sp. CONT]